MTRPASGSRHQRFCEADAWDLVRSAHNRAADHITYELALGDGRILRTRVSRPAGNDAYGPALWSEILGPHQLDVTEDEFWACVEHGTAPMRPGRQRAVPAEALPAELVYQLLHRVGLSERDVAALTPAQALEVMARCRPGHG